MSKIRGASGSRGKGSKPLSGIKYYDSQGYTEPIIVHLTTESYRKLAALAVYDENSLQVLARRGVDHFVESRSAHINEVEKDPELKERLEVLLARRTKRIKRSQ